MSSARGTGQQVDSAQQWCLPRTYKALGSNPSTTNISKMYTLVLGHGGTCLQSQGNEAEVGGSGGVQGPALTIH